MKPEQILTMVQLIDAVTNSPTLRENEKTDILGEVWRSTSHLAFASVFPKTHEVFKRIIEGEPKDTTHDHTPARPRGRPRKEATGAAGEA